MDLVRLRLFNLPVIIPNNGVKIFEEKSIAVKALISSSKTSICSLILSDVDFVPRFGIIIY